MLLSGGKQASQKTFFTPMFSSGTAVMVSVGLVLRLRYMLLRRLLRRFLRRLPLRNPA
jgi:hypothetical protein